MLCWQCFSRVTANLVKFERTSVLSKRIACMIRTLCNSSIEMQRNGKEQVFFATMYHNDLHMEI